MKINRILRTGFVLACFAPMPGCLLPPGQEGVGQAAASSATPGRLAEPPVPEDPTQYEQGRHLYWLNCMPCHGDKGQGLTDEFRSLWVEDHQNCWARGCHAGRVEDLGFPIPRTVPALVSSAGDLPPFETAGEFFKYLQTTHPPQHPGYLPAEEYWAIVAYILAENNRLPPGGAMGP